MVVAATDGTMPQTKEHLLLANQVHSSSFLDPCVWWSHSKDSVIM